MKTCSNLMTGKNFRFSFADIQKQDFYKIMKMQNVRDKFVKK